METNLTYRVIPDFNPLLLIESHLTLDPYTPTLQFRSGMCSTKLTY